ncbi:cobalamin B12-binding domain-containing protein [Streptomyces phaeochromogenes]|uniref:cobalamin B12-binding domain-containing protein n=1 Tax=Streptomyces phaeochromogenes TaxID=1923 RepID=UPI0006E18235|nr:cobalamin-dependent protein [Streptomyces phaeochromogenes]
MVNEPARLPAPRGTVIVSSVASDAHTWNLVLLQLLLEEMGYHVINLGPCVPDALLVEECVLRQPTMVVISSINGHGYADGLRLAPRLRARPELAATPIVIGGKLGVVEDATERDRQSAVLLEAGFDAVFADAHATDLCRYLRSGEPVGQSTGTSVGPSAGQAVPRTVAGAPGRP